MHGEGISTACSQQRGSDTNEIPTLETNRSIVGVLKLHPTKLATKSMGHRDPTAPTLYDPRQEGNMSYQTALMRSMAASRARAMKKLNGGHNGKRRGLVRGEQTPASAGLQEPIPEPIKQEVSEALVAG